MPKETRIDLQAERLVRDLCLWPRRPRHDLRLPPALHSAVTHASVNAFCIIKWNNHEVGRTSVVAGTNAPQFSAANFIIPITADGDGRRSTDHGSVAPEECGSEAKRRLGRVVQERKAKSKKAKESDTAGLWISRATT